MFRQNFKLVKAFTLAELLIALAILGVIATFTIPKVLVANQSAQFKAIGKENISAISAAYIAYKNDKGTAPSNMSALDLTPYFNYVKVDTVSQVDDQQGGTGTFTCSVFEPCLKMHNGSLLYFRAFNFGGTNNTNAVSFFMDPDAKLDLAPNGSGKMLMVYLYYNGRVTDVANIGPTTTDNSGLQFACVSCVPPWFSWN